MSTIEFDEPNSTFRTIDISGAVTHNTPFLIKWGVVKDLKTANMAMILGFIILVIVSITIFNLRPSAIEKEYREDFTAAELRHMHPDMVNNLPAKPK